LKNAALLKLLQLASPTLPVGAYSYSEGLEFLVHAGKITDRLALEQWLTQELLCGAIRLEAAVMVRSYQAWEAKAIDRLQFWNHWLAAARETEELRLQSWQMGRSLLRLFAALQAPQPIPFALDAEPCNFAIVFGLVAAEWQIDLSAATLGYLHSWATNLISAGIKLIPLGQTAGQTLLLTLQPSLEQAMQKILLLQDHELGSCGWGLSLASMAHETQYSRLFRS
jgi:urease accessory protein